MKPFAKTLLLLCAAFAPAAFAAELPLPTLTFSDSNAVNRLTPRNVSAKSLDGFLYVGFQKTAWPNVLFECGKAYKAENWTGIGALAFDVRNPEDAPVEMHVRVDDKAPDGRSHARSGSATLAAGERATLVLPLESTALDMRGGPPYPLSANGRQMQSNGVGLNLARVVQFQIFLAHPDRTRKLHVYSVSPLPPPDFKGMVDRYGQFVRAEWPGKINTDDGLARAKSDEQAWLREHPPLADRDEFGGLKNGPQLKATGFFRVESEPIKNSNKDRKRWWLVTPTGHLFWSAGSDCVRPNSGGPIRGREYMFSWLPDGAAKRGSVDFYQINLQRKYGEKWESEWIDQSCTRLPAWGFNTIANWSDEKTFTPHRVPFVATVSFGGLPYITATNYEHKPGPDHRLADFFEEKFPALADAAIAKEAVKWAKDPWCVGFYVHNELAWDTWAQGGLGTSYFVAREAIAAPPTLAARRAFVKLLREKYQTVEAFAKSWGVTATSWDDRVELAAAKLNEASRADCAAFMTALAERYFTTIRDALRRHAPNHLYLGCRFAIRPREVVDVAAKYCDVVSFNIYNDTIDPAKWNFLNDLGKPVIIGEFHFGATDRGMFHPGLRRTANQAARAEAYVAYVRSALATPALVGCHWFQYVDQPLTGRFDGENYNIGLVSIVDTPYPELTTAARGINSQVYRLHSEAGQ